MVTLDSRVAGIQTLDLLITSPASYRYANKPHIYAYWTPAKPLVTHKHFIAWIWWIQLNLLAHGQILAMAEWSSITSNSHLFNLASTNTYEYVLQESNVIDDVEVKQLSALPDWCIRVLQISRHWRHIHCCCCCCSLWFCLTGLPAASFL